MNQPLSSKQVQKLPIGFNPTSDRFNRKQRRLHKQKQSLRGVLRIQEVFSLEGVYIKRILHYGTPVGIGGNKNM